ncbi:hypothetical protein ACC731_37695, partial [Rhizobium ruizarguesonis]
VELHGSSIGNGGYRQNGYRLNRATDLVTSPQPASIEQPAKVSLLETNGKAKTAVLDVVTTQPVATVPAQSTQQSLSPQRLNLADTLDN